MQNKELKKDEENSTEDYSVYMVMGTRFEIDKNYEIIDPIGSGAYGVVVAAKDHSNNGELVAIKKIEKAFEHKIFTQRTLRELKIMRLMQHENVLSIRTILAPQSREKFNEIYVVSELMETDLA